MGLCLRILFGAVGCVMFVICFATTKERVQPVNEERVNILRDLKKLWRNDQWRILSVYNFTWNYDTAAKFWKPFE